MININNFEFEVFYISFINILQGALKFENGFMDFIAHCKAKLIIIKF